MHPDPDVLLQAVNSGLASLTWERDGFAFADSYDEVEQRYRGLQAGQIQEMELLRAALLVKPEVARRQLDEERKANDGASGDEVGAGGDRPPIIDGPPLPRGIADGEKDQPLPRRFHGSVELDAARVGRDASQVADEVISHLSGLVGAEVTVTLEIAASIPDGAPDNVVRTVTENSNTLKFQSHGFEKD